MKSRFEQLGKRTAPLRPTLFLAGDACFFVTVGVLTTMTMQFTHRWEWGFVPSVLTGMVLAMMVQTLLALLVSPLLGSIESMVPSMLIAMVSPMFVCALHVVGCEPGMQLAGIVGAASGLGVFLFVAAYGRGSTRRLAARVPDG